VPNLLMLASGVGLVAATAALSMKGWRRADHRFFAGLISIAVTLSLFSVVAWAATAIVPLPLPGFLSARSLSSLRCDCIDSDALAARHARQLCGDEREADVHQPAGFCLQASHDAGLLVGPPGNCVQNCAGNRAGGGDDRLRPGAHTSGRELPPFRYQRRCRACATRRKDPSGRCRMIYVTSDPAMRSNGNRRIRPKSRPTRRPHPTSRAVGAGAPPRLGKGHPSSATRARTLP
jgi:hypothetical protein